MTIWILAPFDHEMYGARVDEYNAVYFTDYEKAVDAMVERCSFRRPEYDAYVQNTSANNEAARVAKHKLNAQNKVLKAAGLDLIPARPHAEQSIKSFREWLMSPFGQRDYVLIEVEAG